MKNTFVQIAGIVGIVAVILGTFNTDALASRRHHRHYPVNHHHNHGHRR
jgi:uncharacterized membrane protein YgdD (TMEM256/DUF423 family)